MRYAVDGTWLGSGGARVRLLAGLLAACAVCPPLRADPVGYAGKVVDGAGAAIPWAFIKVDGASLIAQSGADGSFSVTADAPAAGFYADPRPVAPRFASSPSAPETRVPLRFLVSGRAASGAYLATTLLLTAPGGGDPAAMDLSPDAFRDRAIGTPAPRVNRNLPPPPPVLAKGVEGANSAKSANNAVGGYGLTIAMANFRTGNFPQSTASAKGLILTLIRSGTDTAVYAAEKKLCLDTINAYRASVGLKALAWSKSLEAFADQGARYDSERNSAHGHFGAFVKNAIPTDAENAIPGWPLKNYKNVAAVVAKGAEAMWGEGPGGGHYENIKGNHTAVGCGIYVTPAGAVWVLHDFK
ncbi:MAG: hypothetical protein JWP91_1234 [Fibrobacteres bacterium]|nr:hypothetical protein [Fibrobacterota bacterium]